MHSSNIYVWMRFSLSRNLFLSLWHILFQIMNFASKTTLPINNSKKILLFHTFKVKIEAISFSHTRKPNTHPKANSQTELQSSICRSQEQTPRIWTYIFDKYFVLVITTSSLRNIKHQQRENPHGDCRKILA